MQQKICLVLSVCINLAQALNAVSSAPAVLPDGKISRGSALAPGASSPNLSGIDNNANDLIQLKRKLEVEKAQAEIKKFRGTEDGSSNSGIVQDHIQTTVTGVAINQGGKKIAWLQFANGGSLIVNVGSQIGKYTVSDITMTGVKLSYGGGKHKLKSIFLNRAYYALEKPKNQSNTNNHSFFSPSPIITGANTVDGNEMVPPIVSSR